MGVGVVGRSKLERLRLYTCVIQYMPYHKFIYLYKSEFIYFCFRSVPHIIAILLVSPHRQEEQAHPGKPKRDNMLYNAGMSAGIKLFFLII